jgi:hypothetical protein
MAVKTGWATVSCPSGVSDTSVAFKSFLQVNIGASNQLLELGDFANFLESDNLALFVSINAETGGIIATVFKAGETYCL